MILCYILFCYLRYIPRTRIYHVTGYYKKRQVERGQMRIKYRKTNCIDVK